MHELELIIPALRTIILVCTAQFAAPMANQHRLKFESINGVVCSLI